MLQDTGSCFLVTGLNETHPAQMGHGFVSTDGEGTISSVAQPTHGKELERKRKSEGGGTKNN